MTPREEWRMFYGIVRRRWKAEEEGPEHFFAGLPKKWRSAIEYAGNGTGDKLAVRYHGRILDIQSEKRDIFSWRNRRSFNCRCTMRPIITDDKTGS